MVCLGRVVALSALLNMRWRVSHLLRLALVIVDVSVTGGGGLTVGPAARLQPTRRLHHEVLRITHHVRLSLLKLLR